MKQPLILSHSRNRYMSDIIFFNEANGDIKD